MARPGGHTATQMSKGPRVVNEKEIEHKRKTRTVEHSKARTLYTVHWEHSSKVVAIQRTEWKIELILLMVHHESDELSNCQLSQL